MTRIPLVSACIAALLLLAACAGSNAALPPAPNVSAANQAAAEYLIGPGDVLDIFVWRNPDLSRQVPVRPDGIVSIPLVGDTIAAGKTPQVLATELQQKLQPLVVDPRVTVIPTQFVGPFTQQIRVIGEAAQPRALAYRANMSVLDVMIEVGGLTKFANGNGAVVVRRDGNMQQSYQVRLDDLIRDGDVSKNVTMQPGDILIIPQRYF